MHAFALLSMNQDMTGEFLILGKVLNLEQSVNTVEFMIFRSFISILESIAKNQCQNVFNNQQSSLSEPNNIMDFEKLAEILPKLSTTWTVADTQKWIQFTGLQNLAEKFQNLGIDGSCLHSLTEEDFREQLGVSSKIMLKKIMTWVQTGFNGFDDYLKNNSKLSMTIKSLSPLKSKKSKEMGSNPKIQEAPQIYENEIKRQATYTDPRPKNQQNQLIIKQCQVPHANFYSFKNKGGMMGRNGNNQISISDQFVSRFHAQILFEEGEYFIRDCGSNSGTFLRITQKKQLYNDIILEMGSNQFLVDMTDRHAMALKVIDGPNTDNCFVVPKKDKITIGRKPHNEINFPEDHHLSNIHATIFNANGIWYVEDVGSTNGTWIRLSQQGVKSAKWKLQDKAQFKLSTNLTYECRRNTQNRKTEKQRVSQKCIACKEADRNAIILPCKHNIYCYDCITQLGVKVCDTCGASISDVIKIFKV